MATIRYRLAAILTVCLFLSLLGVASGQQGRKKDKKNPPPGLITDIDAEGVPKGAAGNPDKPTFFVWREGDNWCVRLRSRDLRVFTGRIFVHDGKVTKISNIAGMEPGKVTKGKALGDFGRLNPPQNNLITFNMRTGRKGDKFDFRVSPDATAVSFDFRISEYQGVPEIIIGAGEKKPPTSPFSLPALAAKPPQAKP